MPNRKPEETRGVIKIAGNDSGKGLVNIGQYANNRKYEKLLNNFIFIVYILNISAYDKIPEVKLYIYHKAIY